jgi:cell filamentation protein, protein adenylyltransferase
MFKPDTIIYRICEKLPFLNRRVYVRILAKKKKLDAARPLPPSVAAQIARTMRVEYTYNSNAIEGNTLTLNETKIVIEDGITVGGKPLREIQEVKNHPEAIGYVEEVGNSKELIEQQILTIHQIIMKDVVEDAGRYRTGMVTISGSNYMPPPPHDIPFQMQDMIGRYNRNIEELSPIELAAWLHHRFVQIHPFRDGNGRVARLLMNLTLLRHGYPMAVIRKVDRKKYYDALQKADNGKLAPLSNFIASSVEQSLDDYLRAIDPNAEPLISIREASKGTRFSQEYLSLLVRTRRIPARKIGKNWMVTRKDVREYAKRRKKARSRHP